MIKRETQLEDRDELNSCCCRRKPEMAATEHDRAADSEEAVKDVEPEGGASSAEEVSEIKNQQEQEEEMSCADIERTLSAKSPTSLSSPKPKQILLQKYQSSSSSSHSVTGTLPSSPTPVPPPPMDGPQVVQHPAVRHPTTGDYLLPHQLHLTPFGIGGSDMVPRQLLRNTPSSDDDEDATGPSGVAVKAKKKRGNLPKEAVTVLKKWLHDNRFHPYPTEPQKFELSRELRLTMVQVNNWFINGRRRYLDEMLWKEGRDPNEFKIRRKSVAKGEHRGASGKKAAGKPPLSAVEPPRVYSVGQLVQELVTKTGPRRESRVACSGSASPGSRSPPSPATPSPINYSNTPAAPLTSSSAVREESMQTVDPTGLQNQNTQLSSLLWRPYMDALYSTGAAAAALMLDGSATATPASSPLFTPFAFAPSTHHHLAGTASSKSSYQPFPYYPFSWFPAAAAAALTSTIPDSAHSRQLQVDTALELTKPKLGVNGGVPAITNNQTAALHLLVNTALRSSGVQ